MAASRQPQGSAPNSGSGDTRGTIKVLESFWTPNRAWFGLFGIWGVLLTGTTWGFTGSPGFLQQYRLSSLYESKQMDLAGIEAEVLDLNTESERLEKSTFAQEREVRKVLGYVGPDEMIFDFSASAFSYQGSNSLMSASAD